MKHSLSVVALVFTASSAMGQAFNIDYTGSLAALSPATNYGGAAGQTGLWAATLGGPEVPLRDISGSLTAAKSNHLGGGFLNLNVPTTNSDERNLMNDGITLDSGIGNFITIGGMQPGWYDIYVYCWAGPGSVPFGSRVYTEFGSVGLGANSDLPWPGGQVEGITYGKATIQVLTGLSIQTSPPLNRVLAVSGIQLVPVPAPGGFAAMALGGVFAFGRRRR